MYRAHEGHLQAPLFSDLDHLSEKARQRLEESWAGAFYREFFCRLDERPFAVLYSEVASRPNVPINVLMGLETLKAGFGWSDQEMHDAFLFDMQVRYALGYRNLGEGEFDVRTIYNFRQRVNEHMGESVHGPRPVSGCVSGVGSGVDHDESVSSTCDQAVRPRSFGVPGMVLSNSRAIKAPTAIPVWQMVLKMLARNSGSKANRLAGTLKYSGTDRPMKKEKPTIKRLRVEFRSRNCTQRSMKLLGGGSRGIGLSGSSCRPSAVLINCSKRAT